MIKWTGRGHNLKRHQHRCHLFGMAKQERNILWSRRNAYALHVHSIKPFKLSSGITMHLATQVMLAASDGADANNRDFGQCHRHRLPTAHFNFNKSISVNPVGDSSRNWIERLSVLTVPPWPSPPPSQVVAAHTTAQPPSSMREPHTWKGLTTSQFIQIFVRASSVDLSILTHTHACTRDNGTIECSRRYFDSFVSRTERARAHKIKRNRLGPTRSCFLIN